MSNKRKIRPTTTWKGMPFETPAGPMLYVRPDISDYGLPLSIRDRANMTGRCPDCGATPSKPKWRRGMWRSTFAHEAGCRCLVDTPKTFRNGFSSDG